MLRFAFACSGLSSRRVDPRNDPEARVQKSEFLKPDGAVIDVCGGAPCLADQS